MKNQGEATENTENTESAENARPKTGRLTEMRIANFKAFGDEQSLPIKPLTLIFGANSSGKSSLIHALLLANHAVLEKGEVDVHRPKLAGQSVDLGGFAEFVHQHDTKRSAVLEFAIRPEPFSSAVQTRLMRIRFEIGKAMHGPSGKQAIETVGVSAIEVELDDVAFLRIERAHDDKLHIVNINLKHGLCGPFFERLQETYPEGHTFGAPIESEDMALHEAYADQSYERFHPALVEAASKLPLTQEFMPTSSRPWDDNSDSYYYWREVWEQTEEKEFGNKLGDIFTFYPEEWLKWIREQFHEVLEALRYLGPLRCYPAREFSGRHDEDPNWFSGGGHAWEVLRDDPAVLKQVNEWLASLQGPGAMYELKPQTPIRREAARKRLAAKLETESSKPVDLLQSALSSTELILADRQTGVEVTHRDVGVGISQVLPVLVHAFADENQLVAIEQPEIHLHPALQAELGDVFIKSALGERQNTFILETHSEHLILRIMRRIRETHLKKLPKDMTPVYPKDVAVLYVEKDGSRSIVREMPLNEMGELVKAWPGGFFEESFREWFA